MPERQRKILKECADVVMQDYSENMFPERRLFALQPVPDTPAWDVHFQCGLCTSGVITPGLRIVTYPETTPDKVMGEMHEYIRWHLSKEHGASA